MYDLEFGEEESREQHGTPLTNIGKLYAAGGQSNITKLFRPVTFPVSRGTTMLNSKIEWDHSQRIFVPKFGLETQSGKNAWIGNEPDPSGIGKCYLPPGYDNEQRCRC